VEEAVVLQSFHYYSCSQQQQWQLDQTIFFLKKSTTKQQPVDGAEIEQGQDTASNIIVFQPSTETKIE